MGSMGFYDVSSDIKLRTPCYSVMFDVQYKVLILSCFDSLKKFNEATIKLTDDGITKEAIREAWRFMEGIREAREREAREME
jgi:hypothetical protein